MTSLAHFSGAGCVCDNRPVGKKSQPTGQSVLWKIVTVPEKSSWPRCTDGKRVSRYKRLFKVFVFP